MDGLEGTRGRCCASCAAEAAFLTPLGLLCRRHGTEALLEAEATACYDWRPVPLKRRRIGREDGEADRGQ